MPLDAIIDGMCDLLSGSTARLGGGVPSTRRLILSAIMKMVAQYGSCPTAAAALVDDYTKSSDPDAQRRCLEFQTILTQAPHLLGEVFPVDASLEDVDVDMNLSFMDAIVGEAISNGAQPYQKPEDDDDDEINAVASQAASAFKMTPYEKPSEKTFGQGAMQGMGSTNMGVTGAPKVTLPPGSSSGAVGQQAVASPTQQPTNPGEPQLVLRNVANVWGKQAPPPQAPSASVPSTSSFASTPAAAPAGYGGYGGFGATPAVAAAPVAPVKTAEQLEKERMYAALFGGISGAPAPPPPVPTPAAMAAPQMTPAASVPQPIPVTPAVTSPQFTPAVSAAPEVDLLGFDMESSTTTATVSTVDMLSPTPLVEAPAPAPPAAPPAPATPAPAPADPCKFFL